MANGLTTHEAARIMRCSADTVRREIKRGHLIAVDVGLYVIPVEAVFLWLKSDRPAVIHGSNNSHMHRGRWKKQKRQEQYDNCYIHGEK